MDSYKQDTRENDYKRLFILGGKTLTENEWRDEFGKYGDVKHIWMTKDRQGDPKGVTYITFSKVSEAALALEELNGKFIYGLKKPIKVIIASQPKDGSVRERREDEKLLRLFIIVPKGQKEDDVRDHFEKFGEIDYIRVLKHRDTKMGMGLAYVKYFKPSSCARALEECNAEYKAVIAEAEKSKNDKRQEAQTRDYYYDNNPMPSSSGYIDNRSSRGRVDSLMGGASVYNDTPIDMVTSLGNAGNNCRLEAQLSQQLTQDQVFRLFDLVPGLENLNFNKYQGIASMRYQTPACAEYAICKLNNFEYPPGQRIYVYQPVEQPQYANTGSRYDMGGMQNTMTNLQSSMSNVASGGGDIKNNLETLLSSIQEATSVLKAAGFDAGGLGSGGGAGFSGGMGGASMGGALYQGGGGEERVRWCNVTLPMKKPFAMREADVVERLFVVCRGDSFGDQILEDAFCRFGNLISGHFVKGRNYAYVKFADKLSAAQAIEYLNEQEVCGLRIKVMLADPPKNDRDGDGGQIKRQRLK